MDKADKSVDLSPSPNPSIITAEAIDRAVANVESRIMARIDGMEKAVEVFHADLTRVPTSVDKAILSLRELLETRLECMENDIKGIHVFLDKRGKDISEQIVHLHELVNSNVGIVSERLDKLKDVSEERFARIDTQFVERDKRTDQLSLADKTAVAAALQAAKEAVGAQNTSNSIAIAKSESLFIESIKQLQTLFNSAIAALNDKVNDVKSRLDRGEGGAAGTKETHSDNRVLISMVIAAVAVLISLGSIFSKLVSAPAVPQVLYVPAPGASPMVIPPQQNGVPR